MRKEFSFTGVMLLVLLFAGMCWAKPVKNGSGSGDVDPSSRISVSDAGDPQWALLFYLAADNEQEAYADATIAQLMAGTSLVPNHPRILVLLDRLSTAGTEVFEIDDGKIVNQASYPEQDTADGAVLGNFVTEGLKRMEQEKIAVVVKSEGLSWRGIGRDNTHDDQLDDQLMPTGELAEALKRSMEETGKDIDLLVLEGSIMAFIEVVYELRDTAPVLLATQSKIQPDGLPWQMVIEDLGAAPDLTAEKLGVTITDDHITYYADKGNNGVPKFDTSINFAAMTVYDMSHVDDVLDAHKHWAATTWPLFDEIYNILPHARDLSEVGGFGEITDFDYQFDIKTFMVESLRLIDEAGLSFAGLDDMEAAVADYLDAQDKLIIYERSPEDGFKQKAANGLSIWYPPTWNKYYTSDESDEVFGSTMFYADSDIGLDWVGDSNWIEYLFEYFDRADANLAGNGPEGDEPPKKGVFEKIDRIETF
ncbi:MAG: clostripain-related cysteine peptidase [Pseudomonadota bacterium]